jgi:hypothetical protein
MKLKDIVPCCLTYAKKPGNGFYDVKYYWIINGLTYTIDSLETKNSDFTDGLFNYKTHFNSVDYIHLSRYNFVNANETQREYDPKDNYLVLNLDNEITIFDRFILVHKTGSETTKDERKIFQRQNYYIANGYGASAENYTIGLFCTDSLGGMKVDLRTVFKDLIEPPVSPKPAELTLDEKLDDLVDEIMKDSRSMAIKKLKRMLNERL